MRWAIMNCCFNKRIHFILFIFIWNCALHLKGTSMVVGFLHKEIRCPKPFGLFPHPENCSKFLNCAHDTAHIISCPVGTLFNLERRICDHERNVHCVLVGEVSTTPEVVTSRHRYVTPTRHDLDDDTTPTPTTPKPSKGILSFFGKVARIVGGVVNVARDVKERLKNATKKIRRKLRNKKDKVMDENGLNFIFKEKDSKLLCLKPKGQFPYTKDCSKFINCWQGKPTLMECPDGLLFDASTHNCDWPGQAICALRSVYSEVESEAPPSTPPFSGQYIRLRRGGAPYVGYLQVWFEEDWRPVVLTEEKWEAKDQICRGLGFTRGAHSETRGLVYGWPKERRVKEEALVCHSRLMNLGDCSLMRKTYEELAKYVVGIRCRKNSVSECSPKWHRWGKKCFFVDITTKVSHKNAKKHCEDKNGRLLSITNQEENDFISYLVASGGGSSLGFYSGGTTFILREERYWLWEGTNSPLSKSLEFDKWWQGWDKDWKVNHSIPNLDMKMSQCICLEDTFPADQSPEQFIHAKYFFWKLCDCKKKLNFVCEMEPHEIGCITGRGENYNGTANTTASGSPCLMWNTLGATYKGLLHLRNMTENYCSNPDGDDLPWCYVAGKKAEFCDIPRCPSHKPIKVDTEDSKCSSGSYTCKNGQCIHLEWVCDGQRDCPQGEEEEDCPDYSHIFVKHSGFLLNGSQVEKWLFSPKTTCAIRCIQAKSFICHSFNYQESTSTCILSKSNAGKSGGLIKNLTWEYHERADLAPNCSNSFLCSDYKCISEAKICDGRRHCSSGEDETGCFDSSDFQVRLVNGSGENEGRVEVKVSGYWEPVCDDMWGIEDGNVVCRELGFKRGAKKTYTDSYFGNGVEEFSMDDLNCNGDENSLALCNFGGWNEHDCNKNEAAGVWCNLDSEECTTNEWRCKNGRCIEFLYYCDQIDDCGDGSDEDLDVCASPVVVRLGLDTRSSSKKLEEGRVEVRHKGIWGTICDDDIALSEGHVICRMMGWEGASTIFKNSSFGPGYGPIWIDGLRCRGNENDLTECQHDRWGYTNCNHTEDLGIKCTNKLAEEERDKILEKNPPTVLPPVGVLPSKCGVRYVADSPKEILASPRIVDGHIPKMGANPWMAGIRRRKSFGSSHECGAFILNEDLLLTAAHCVWKYTLSKYLVRTGDFNNEEVDTFEEEWMLEKIITHPFFDKGSLFNNDLAIIKIKRKGTHAIRFNERVQPICLVNKDFNYPSGMNCTVAGWGTISAVSGFSRILQSSLLPILPDSLCREDYVYGPTRISAGMFCAGYMEGGIDTCQGDSGGPLVCQVKGRYTAVGITSWGHGCARANKPGVYTRLTYYLDWIYNVTQGVYL